MEMTYVTHTDNVEYLKKEGVKIKREVQFDAMSEITIEVNRQTLIEIFYAGVKAGIDKKF
jgi:hypothetical protein